MKYALFKLIYLFIKIYSLIYILYLKLYLLINQDLLNFFLRSHEHRESSYRKNLAIIYNDFINFDGKLNIVFEKGIHHKNINVFLQ